LNYSCTSEIGVMIKSESMFRQEWTVQMQIIYIKRWLILWQEP